jgi:hypothetical protein
MPKSKQPDANQMALLVMAKATGTPVPEHLKQFEHLVKKSPQKPAKKARK